MNLPNKQKALISDHFNITSVAASRNGVVAEIPIVDISSRQQIRSVFADLEGLAESLREEGQISPINVSRSTTDPNKYVIEQGERRWRAAKLAGLKTIKAIAAQSNAEINIDDNGTVMIYGRNNASAQEAKKLVLSIIEEPEVGHIYHGTVKRIVDFGAFIEILPGKEGLCHISKLARTRVKNVSDVLSVGQQVDVKLIEIDRMGRLNLSYIDAQPENAEKK